MNKISKFHSSADFKTPCPGRSSLRRKSSTSILKIPAQSAYLTKLEVDRRKLISADSQLIIAVLDETLMSLQITSRFASVCENYDYFESFLGPEVASACQYLCTALKYSFNHECPCDEQKAAQAKTDAEFVESMKSMSSTQRLVMYPAPPMQRLYGTVKYLTRRIYEKREALNAVSMDSKPSPAMLKLLECVEELRKLVFDRLQLTYARERERFLFLEGAPAREKILTNKIAAMERELASLSSSTAEQVNALNEEAARMEDSLETSLKLTSDRILQRRMSSFLETVDEQKDSKKRQRVLNLEYQGLLQQYEELQDTHLVAQLNLRRKNFKCAVEGEQWIQRYDAVMSEKQLTFEALTDEYNIEKQKLAKLEEIFRPVQEQHKIMVAERMEARYLNAVNLVRKAVQAYIARKRLKQQQHLQQQMLLLKLKLRKKKK